MNGQAADERRLRLDDYLPFRLSVASNAVTGLIARAHQDRFDVSVPQWRLLCVLAEDPGLTQAQLVARTMMDKVTVSRAAQGLLSRALLDRADHEADGRSHVLKLSDAGRALYGEIAPLAQAYEAALISGLSPEQVNQLKRLLHRLQAAAEQLAGGAELVA